jgi:aryl-alcohol dehydrogenase-like predicted oxidoreductase
MEFRNYPNTDIEVSVIGFGLWTTATGWWGTMSDTEAVKLLQQAADLDVTLFDAADAYGNGRSEEQLAQAFAGRRDQVVYSTKFGYDFYNNLDAPRGQQELPQNVSLGFVRYALEQSLRRLHTDYIDIYSLHNAKLDHIRNGSLFDLLESFKTEGKIRSYGITLGPAIGWLYEGLEAVRRADITNIQMIWNILEQFPGGDIIQAARHLNARTGYQIRVPHSSGLLEGHFTRETAFLPSDHRSHRPRSWLVNGVKKVETLRFLERPDRTLGQSSIQWLLADPRVMTVLPNIYNAGQLQEFVAAPDTPKLTKAELEQINTLACSNFGVNNEPVTYRGCMIPPTEAAL